MWYGEFILYSVLVVGKFNINILVCLFILSYRHNYILLYDVDKFIEFTLRIGQIKLNTNTCT